ncbi:GFA family protein [Methylobacterium sp. Leaf118]|uniref:GFA family protein n=1 Tax=Methylobacterium sp. Leaf118 TaxID=2876562 RepID=UPI001E30AE92|nr:GFA family protein [Methylobacterium sp. Leaf118]
MLSGRCHCGAITYAMSEEVMHCALCHCSDCRRHAGAPMVGWAMVRAEQVTIEGEPTVYHSSEHGRRHFCGRCGTGLFYVNEQTLPGLIDVQTGTLDTPEALPAQVHIQVAERIAWMEDAHQLPAFARYPAG